MEYNQKQTKLQNNLDDQINLPAQVILDLEQGIEIDTMNIQPDDNISQINTSINSS